MPDQRHPFAPSPEARLTPELVDGFLRDATEMLQKIRPLLRPVLAADLKERLWAQAARLRELCPHDQPDVPPLVSRPCALPEPLNPLFFARRRGEPHDD